MKWDEMIMMMDDESWAQMNQQPKAKMNDKFMFIAASQLGTGFFSFWSSFFGLKIIIPFLSLLSIFIVFSFLFFLPWAFSFSLLCFENGPWELPPGIFSRTLFRFFLCIVLAMFPSFCLKLSKKNFFEPFFFVLVFFRLCIQKWSWKLSKGFFLGTLFVANKPLMRKNWCFISYNTD